MARCDDCEKLDVAPSAVEPHGQLQELGRDEYRGDGNRRTASIRYRCTVCLTPMVRDMDRRDPDASWEIER